MSHTCPAATCRKTVPDHMLACGPHWAELPGELRRRINDEYRIHGESVELRALHQEAIVAWEAAR